MKRDYLSEAEGVFSAMLSGASEDESVMVSADEATGEMTFVVSVAG